MHIPQNASENNNKKLKQVVKKEIGTEQQVFIEGEDTTGNFMLVKDVME